MLLVYLTLEQDHFTEFDAHYFPETEIRITRLSEPKNYSLTRRSGRTVLCAELPCAVDAKSVARELRATITSREQTIIESVPTLDLTAYDFYLKGVDYRSRSRRLEDFRYAIQKFERAVEIDTNFTLAWVGLASASRWIYWWHYDKSEEHLSQTKEYLDRAIALDPDLMEVQLETGMYYYPHCLQRGVNLTSHVLHHG